MAEVGLLGWWSPGEAPWEKFILSLDRMSVVVNRSQFIGDVFELILAAGIFCDISVGVGMIKLPLLAVKNVHVNVLAPLALVDWKVLGLANILEISLPVPLEHVSHRDLVGLAKS